MTAADYAGNFKQRFTIDPARAALAVIDMQYATGSRHHGLGGESNHCLDSIAPLAGDLVMNKTTASAFRGACRGGDVVMTRLIVSRGRSPQVPSDLRVSLRPG